MIKKLSLYGLCFNLGAAFATPPTQAELEAFIATQGDNVKVKRTLFGAPDRITLKNEAAYKAWEAFSKWHRDSSGSWSYPPADLEKCDGVPGTTAKMSGEECINLANIRSIFKNYTPEERRACFLKYSKEATAEELALVAGWDVSGLRIVDFDSIVDGLDCEVQKEEARRLMANDEALGAAINRWVNKYYSHNVYGAEIFTLDNPYTKDGPKLCIGQFPYRLTQDTISLSTDQLKSVLKDMSHYESTRGILVLSLVLVKPLGMKALSLLDIDHRNAKLLSLTYDLREMLYNQLGICAHYSMLGDLGSALELDLFRLGSSPADAEPVKVPSALFQRLFYENYSDDSLDPIEIPQQKFFRAAQIALLWFNLEDVWYRIGFANVDDTIYVNRMSAMNLLKTPAIFPGSQKFTDLKRLFGLDIDPPSYPLIDQFLRDMDLTSETDLSRLCPMPEAWKAWLQLQGRTDVDAGYLPMLKKTKDELTAALLSIDLIGDK